MELSFYLSLFKNVLCSSGVLSSSGLYLPSAGISGDSHQAWIMLVFLFLQESSRVSLCIPGLPGTCCLPQACLKLMILLPYPPESWNCKHNPLHPDETWSFIKKVLVVQPTISLGGCRCLQWNSPCSRVRKLEAVKRGREQAGLCFSQRFTLTWDW